MKAKTRMLWMKLHAYFACFFLPITLLYIVTGMLYFFDFKGEVKSEVEYFFEVKEGFPKIEEKAEQIVRNYLVKDKFVELPQDQIAWHIR